MKKKRKNASNDRILFFFVLFIITSVFFIAVGYSSFSVELFTDEFIAYVRPDFKVRVNAFSMTGGTNGGTSTGVDYNASTGFATLSLPNRNSSVTYTVEIKNYGNKEIQISDISVPSALENKLNITLNGYTIGDKLKDNADSCENSVNGCKLNITRTFTITVSYKNGAYSSSSTEFNNFVLTFTFTEISWYNSCTSYSPDLKCRLLVNETPYADNVSSTNVSSSSGINFSNNASNSNGLGLYYTADSSKTEDIDGDGAGERVYYYRGLVTNNFVRFDSYCWRIVRINEDGSIRLIYAGSPSNGSCPQNGSSNVYINSGRYNTTANDNTYVGYMYGSSGASNYTNAHRNTNNSAVKSTIDSWYNTNLSDSASYIADEIFCNDRYLYSGNGYGTSTSVYGPETRFYTNSSNQTPTFKCTQSNDKFTVGSSKGNGALTYPIGLITADEVSYAGTRYYNSNNASNTNHYLYSSNYFWTMSPADFENSNSYVFIVNSSGYMRLVPPTYTSNTVYIRPVINLLADVAFSGGTGTYNNPYTIEGFTDGHEEDPDDPQNPDNPPTPSSEYWYDNCASDSTLLNCKMLANSNPTSDESISFSSFSSNSNGNGLYYTTDLTRTTDLDSDGTGERVYYYRGAVTDNFVYFGGFCWRIVRTNEDSTIRIIYGGTMSNNSCPQNGTSVSIGNSAYNSTATDNAYVGYMYGSTGASNYNNAHRNTNNSTVKTTVDNWYRNNLTSYASYLADEVFCNDRQSSSGNAYGTNTAQYAPYTRLNQATNPTLKCTQANDKFTVNTSNGNGALTYPIGLITADEIYYAGSKFDGSNTNTSYYLYTNTNTWTMSPSDLYSSAIYVFYVSTGGVLRIQNNVSQSYAVRPVVNLLSTIVVSSGNGTYNNPYRVSLP